MIYYVSYWSKPFIVKGSWLWLVLEDLEEPDWPIFSQSFSCSPFIEVMFFHVLSDRWAHTMIISPRLGPFLPNAM